MGQLLFRHRGWIPAPLIMAAIYWTAPISIGTGLGVGLVALGLLVRVWAMLHIGPLARSRTATVKKLVYTGPYELTRNPLYIANIVIYSGVGLATVGIMGAASALLLSFLHYSLIVRHEETFLHERLGEIYRSYMNRVPRWFGEAAPVHAAAPKGSMEERLNKALHAERSTIALAIFVTALVLIRAATSS